LSLKENQNPYLKKASADNYKFLLLISNVFRIIKPTTS
jgi:hypothetical protein